MRAGGSRKVQANRARFLTTVAKRSVSFVQAKGRRRRRAADAPRSAARRTCLLGINCGEQLLHGARRRCAEPLVEVDRLRKLLADEVIVPREFGVVRERLLNAAGVAAAQRPRRMPRQQASISCRSFSFIANLVRFLSP
jgi:hypothetical protein